jgi:hypothetical protein
MFEVKEAKTGAVDEEVEEDGRVGEEIEAREDGETPYRDSDRNTVLFFDEGMFDEGEEDRPKDDDEEE